MIVNKTVGLVINFSISNFHVFNFPDLFFNFIKYFFDVGSNPYMTILTYCTILIYYIYIYRT